MRSRHRSRSLALTGLAAAALVAPADASGARGFRVPLPKAGEISVARVELRAPGVVRGMRVTNVRRLPRNLFVAGRLTRVRRTNRYIARVVALRKGAPDGSAGAAQDKPPFEPPFVSLLPSRVDIGEFDADANVLTDPDPVPLCFDANPNTEWTRFSPLAHPGLVARSLRDRVTEAGVDAFCGRPVPDGFANRFDTYDAIPFFTGAHRPFEGNAFEHVFRVHGNEDAGSFRINAPPGGAFTLCGGDVPCLVSQGDIYVLGPIPAGEDVDVNGRANVEIPRRVDGDWFPPDSRGPFEGTPRKFYIGARLIF